MAKKVKTWRKFIIAETSIKERETGKNNYEIYTPDEWACGEGFRTPEHDAGTIDECIEWINY